MREFRKHPGHETKEARAVAALLQKAVHAHPMCNIPSGAEPQQGAQGGVNVMADKRITKPVACQLGRALIGVKKNIENRDFLEPVRDHLQRHEAKMPRRSCQAGPGFGTAKPGLHSGFEVRCLAGLARLVSHV